jgi:hypothetical protein
MQINTVAVEKDRVVCTVTVQTQSVSTATVHAYMVSTATVHTQVVNTVTVYMDSMDSAADIPGQMYCITVQVRYIVQYS